jgi:hypothetical protein
LTCAVTSQQHIRLTISKQTATMAALVSWA